LFRFRVHTYEDALRIAEAAGLPRESVSAVIEVAELRDAVRVFEASARLGIPVEFVPAPAPAQPAQQARTPRAQKAPEAEARPAAPAAQVAAPAQVPAPLQVQPAAQEHHRAAQPAREPVRPQEPAAPAEPAPQAKAVQVREPREPLQAGAARPTRVFIPRIEGGDEEAYLPEEERQEMLVKAQSRAVVA